MTCTTAIPIKLVSKNADGSETVLSSFEGARALGEENSFYLPDPSGKWKKHINLKSVLRATASTVELIVFVEPEKATFGQRVKRRMAGLSDDATLNIVIAVTFVLIGCLVGLALFGDVLLGKLIQYSGVIAAVCIYTLLCIRGAASGYPFFFVAIPSTIAAFAVMIGVYWFFHYILAPETTLFVTPAGELGQTLLSRSVGIPSLVLSYLPTIFVILRAMGWGLVVDIAETMKDRSADS